jgi:nucleoside-triphosphatase THEP1
MIFILTGPVHGGKTTFLENSLVRWSARELAPGGFLSVAVTDASGATGYDLLELKSGRLHPYLRRQGEPGAERIGPFFFVPSILERANAIIREAGPRELLIVDEIGPLELQGGGLWPVVREALSRPGMSLLLVVREEILEDVVAALGPSRPLVFDVRDPNVRQLVAASLLETAKVDDGQG